LLLNRFILQICAFKRINKKQKQKTKTKNKNKNKKQKQKTKTKKQKLLERVSQPTDFV
jgi:hypothetical protein